MAAKDTIQRAADKRKQAQDDITEQNLAQAAHTQELMEKAAQERIEREEAARKQAAEDTARAEEESKALADSIEAARVQKVLDEQAQAALDAKNKIVVTVPKPFKLNVDNHNVVNYPAGTYAMPKRHAEHWWSKNNGVVPFEEIAETVNKAADTAKKDKADGTDKSGEEDAAT